MLPDCRVLTAAQAALLRDYADAGGRLVVEGELGDAALAAHPNVVAAPPEGPQLVAEAAPADFAACVHDVPAGAALHLIRYDHDDAADAVAPLPELALELRLPRAYGARRRSARTARWASSCAWRATCMRCA